MLETRRGSCIGTLFHMRSLCSQTKDMYCMTLYTQQQQHTVYHSCG
jgi:hypothetical protein